jgi:hypothetical protein
MKPDSRIGVHANPTNLFLETKILSFIPPYPCIIYFSSTLLYQQQKKTVAIKETTQWKNTHIYIKELKSSHETLISSIIPLSLTKGNTVRVSKSWKADIFPRNMTTTYIWWWLLPTNYWHVPHFLWQSKLLVLWTNVFSFVSTRND